MHYNAVTRQMWAYVFHIVIRITIVRYIHLVQYEVLMNVNIYIVLKSSSSSPAFVV